MAENMSLVALLRCGHITIHYEHT